MLRGPQRGVRAVAALPDGGARSRLGRRRHAAAVGPGERRGGPALRGPQRQGHWRWRRCRTAAARSRPGTRHGAAVGPGERQEVQRLAGHSGGSRRWRCCRTAARALGRLRRHGAAVGPGAARRCGALRGHSGGVRAVAVLPDGQALSAGDDGTVRLWDLEQWPAVRRFEGHNGRVWAVAALPGRRGQALSAGSTVRCGCGTSRAAQEVRRFEGHTGGVCGGGGRCPSAASALSARATMARCGCGTWRAAQEVRRFEGHSGGSWRWRRCRTWPALSAGDDRHGAAVGPGQRRRRCGASRATAAAVRAVAALPERGQVLSAGDDGTVRLWDLASGAGAAALCGPQRLGLGGGGAARARPGAVGRVTMARCGSGTWLAVSSSLCLPGMRRSMLRRHPGRQICGRRRRRRSGPRARDPALRPSRGKNSSDVLLSATFGGPSLSSSWTGNAAARRGAVV